MPDPTWAAAANAATLCDDEPPVPIAISCGPAFSLFPSSSQLDSRSPIEILAQLLQSNRRQTVVANV